MAEPRNDNLEAVLFAKGAAPREPSGLDSVNAIATTRRATRNDKMATVILSNGPETPYGRVLRME